MKLLLRLSADDSEIRRRKRSAKTHEDAEQSPSDGDGDEKKELHEGGNYKEFGTISEKLFSLSLSAYWESIALSPLTAKAAIHHRCCCCYGDDWRTIWRRMLVTVVEYLVILMAVMVAVGCDGRG